MTDLERELDRALSGKSHDPDVAPHAEAAAELRAAFAVEVPEARAESLLFTQGVGLRKRPPLILRLFVPALAVASAIVALVLVSRNAVPGESFYPVRGALQKVGLAAAPVKEVNREIRLARDLLISAEIAALDDPERATDLAFEAVAHLRDARELLGDLDPLDRARRGIRINALEQRAATVIALAQAARMEDETRFDDDDSSGPGSGDDPDDSDDDSSGPGSGDDPDDSDDDSSGSGSGDSDDDSSGPGSGDDSDGDSSGPGSGDDSDGDSSGSGSSGSGSSGSGSSGSGSGDDSSGSG